MKQKMNIMLNWIKEHEAILTVVLGLIILPIAVAFLYYSLAGMLAINDMYNFELLELDLYNPEHCYLFCGVFGSFSLMWIVSGYVFDLASAIYTLVRGKKTRIEEKTEE